MRHLGLPYGTGATRSSRVTISRFGRGNTQNTQWRAVHSASFLCEKKFELTRVVAQWIGPGVSAIEANKPPGRGVHRCHALLLDLDGTLCRQHVGGTSRPGDGRPVTSGVPFEQIVPYMHGIPADQALELAVPGIDDLTKSRLASENI